MYDEFKKLKKNPRISSILQIFISRATKKNHHSEVISETAAPPFFFNMHICWKLMIAESDLHVVSFYALADSFRIHCYLETK